MRRVLGVLLLLVLVGALSACGSGGNLPKPPVGRGDQEAVALPQVTLSPEESKDGALPAATVSHFGSASTPASHANAANAPQWQEVKAQATVIQQEAQEMGRRWEQIAAAVQWVQAHETDEEVAVLVAQMADLVSQAQQDAAQLAVTAGDINYRIDHSEATTLRLSDDIGKMADRIGEMADRILWTELQIGVMADRIVHSEHLINDGTQQTIDQMQESLDQVSDLVRDIMAQSAAIRQVASSPKADAGNGENGGSPNESGGGDQGGASDNGAPGGSSTDSSGNGGGEGSMSESSPQEGGNGGGEGAVMTGASGGGASTGASTAQDRSPRRLEVLSRSLHLNGNALQENLHRAKDTALSLQADDLAAALTQAEQAAAQVALVADDLNAYAKVADQLTPALIARGQTAHAQIAAALQNLNAALSQAEAQAQSLPADDPQAQSLRRILAAGHITVEYLNRWDTEIATIVGP